ncbi:MAG: biopolymer transporter ExbD [Bacteroides sp. SM1_62]|nr:MAG: biopolymer transporter ExbD [Bacteroides sp. SM23_62]KPL22350.1 MAG: biopolymer transporter ExbD [Bacteroides sp. SM1_62]
MARREIQEINAGSMADIAFLLLIFFLVATTMDIDTGISRLLPPMPEEEELDDDQEIRERNVFVVLINKDDDLFVEDGFYDVSELKEMTKEFFLNPDDDPDLSEKRELTTDFFGTMMVSKGVISLRNDIGTSYGKYIEVQNELAAAVNELRNELCMQRFGRRYDDLDPLNDQEAALIDDAKKVFPMAISEAEPKKVGGN